MMIVKAYAKVNLTLSVLNKRADGYHDLNSIMHSVDVFDTIYIDEAHDVSVSCSVPIPENNTVVRAARAYLDRISEGAHIHIEKGIPSEAGMGGASADAAAVLNALESVYGIFGNDELINLGKTIGADVPFCMLGGCAVAEGIGERLTRLPGIALDLLIVKGKRGVSTAKLFSALRLPLPCPDAALAIEAIKRGDKRTLAENLFNALESEAVKMAPEIAEYKQKMLSNGALGAVMTGSGSAVAGIFESGERAKRAAKGFEQADFVRVCKTVCV